MDIRMIAMDLDNTLLRTDKTVSAKTADVLRRCKEEHGILLAFVTARSEAASQSAVDAVAPDILVTCGGALVRCGGKVVLNVPLAAETADAVLRFAREHLTVDCVLAECANGEYFVSYQPDDSVTGDYAHARHHDFSQPLARDVHKLVISLADAAECERMRRAFPACNVQNYTGGNWCFVADAAATKMGGLAAAAAACGISPAAIAAFGDDIGDTDMLAGCGFGVAMGNAVPAAKEAARFTCGPCDEDGLACWLEEHVRGC